MEKIICEHCGREMNGDCRWSDCPNNWIVLPCGARWERGFLGKPDNNPCLDCECKSQDCPDTSRFQVIFLEENIMEKFNWILKEEIPYIKGTDTCIYSYMQDMDNPLYDREHLEQLRLEGSYPLSLFQKLQETEPGKHSL